MCLSVIFYLYDNSIVTYKTSINPNVDLVLQTFRAAAKSLVAVPLTLHSDQGFQYTSHEYNQLTENLGITQSMSRRGNPYDNALSGNFYGKSTAIKALLISLMYKKTRNKLSIIIIDLLGKSGDDGYDVFDGLPPLACPIIKDPDVAYNVFMELYNFNESEETPDKNSHIICVVDEFPKIFEYFDDVDKEKSKNLIVQ